METYQIRLEMIQPPKKDCPGKPVLLTDETIQERAEKILCRMRERGLEQLIIYGDVEHAGNFEYLVG